MNFLQLVKKTVRKSAATIAVPTTVVGQTDIQALFVEWVQDAWKDIQMERLGLTWRTDLDQSLSLVSGTYEYGIGSGLESINLNSLTCHLSNESESKIYHQTYTYYQREIDRVVRASGKPKYFTLAPDDDNLIFWPNPDAAYTVLYEGIKDIEELDSTDDAGAGTSDLIVPAGLKVIYHDAIVWQAVMSYAMHFEDGSKLAEAKIKFRPYKKYFEERFMPIVTLNTSALYRTIASN